MIRRTWVQAHARRMPARPAEYQAVHAELNRAYERDRLIDEAVALMALEIDLALQREAR